MADEIGKDEYQEDLFLNVFRSNIWRGVCTLSTCCERNIFFPTDCYISSEKIVFQEYNVFFFTKHFPE